MNQTIDPEVAAQHAEIDRKARVARDYQTKLGQLSKIASACEQALVSFESKKSFFAERKRVLQSQLLKLWGMERGDLCLQINLDPPLAIVESVSTILAIDAALADAPRAKKHLDEQLRIAKATLAELQRPK